MMNIESIKTEHIIALSLALLGFMCGSLLFHTSHESECAGELVELTKLRLKVTELESQLTRCKAEKIGKEVIDSTAICAKQVQEALKNAKAWTCED